MFLRRLELLNLRFLKLRQGLNSIAVRAMASEENNSVTEGKATVSTPKNVFYNPVQEFNRDLTIAVLSLIARKHFTELHEQRKHCNSKSDSAADIPDSSKSLDTIKNVKSTDTDPRELVRGVSYEYGLRILEGLSASGLRSVRFALEIPGLREVVANDLDATAVEFINQNVKHNGVEHIVVPSQSDACMVMYKERAKKSSLRYDVVDLDPYGAPTMFLDAAVQSVCNGGVLCITSTDAAVLCGNSPEACQAKYGALSLRTKYCHEMALRIMLRAIDSHANRYQRYIEPLLSLSIDFYMRVYVKVFTGQANVKRSAIRQSHVFHCTGCGTFDLLPLAKREETKGNNYKYSLNHLGNFSSGNKDDGNMRCDNCGGRKAIAGPIWNYRLHDYDFVQELLSMIREDNENPNAKFGTFARMEGMLSVALEELPDVPLYYHTDGLCKVLHCTPPTFLAFRSAILNAGYKVSSSHASKNSLKTDAPANVIWDILRCWIQDHPVAAKRREENTPACSILAKQPELQANFTLHPDANPETRKSGMARFQINPQPDWGPQARAHNKGEAGTLSARRQKGIRKAQEKREAKRRRLEEEKATTLNMETADANTDET